MQKLLEQLDLSPEKIEFILEQANRFSDEKLPLVLWGYGSIDFRQLELICQWLEQKQVQPSNN
jgi:Protein of unknown function (DUF2949)